jgi:hypothetical protein
METRRTLTLLFALAALAAWWVGPHAPVYWDSFGYVTQSITGRVGGLLLGRPTFILASHALARAWRSLGGSVWTVEPMLRVVWLLVSAGAAPLTALVARELGMSARAAWWAGLCVALSPAVAHTSDAVLTDGPSMAAVVLSLWLAARATRNERVAEMFAAGCALGVAAGFREQCAAYGVALWALAWFTQRRAAMMVAPLVGASLTLGAPVAWLVIHQPGYLDTIRGWFTAMAHERATHAYGPRDFAIYLGWLVSLGPLALVAAAWAWARHPSAREKLFLALCLPALVQLAALGFYQDISFSPRYLLTAFPCALALPAGLALDRWSNSRRHTTWLALCLVAPALLAGPLLRSRQGPLLTAFDRLPAMLDQVPRDAIVVTGQVCPAVVYRRELGRLAGASPALAPRWTQVCPGWRWPESLAHKLDAERASGRVVVLDLRAEVWPGLRGGRYLREVRGYLDSYHGAPGIVVWGGR